MQHILKYKLFESTEEENEMLEYCKDFIETFVESEEKFKITDYTEGWFSGSRHNNDLTHKMQNESDRVALRFAVMLSGVGSGYNDKIDTNQIDESISLLNKSKSIINRLERYCSDIVFKFEDRYALFVLCFENKDKNLKRNLRIQKVYDELKGYLSNYDRNKTLTFSNANGTDVKVGREKLFNLLMENPVFKDKDEKTILRQLSLRYSASTTLDGDTININMATFKYKTWSMSAYKSINLSNPEVMEVVRIVTDKYNTIVCNKMKYLLKIDGDSDRELTKVEINDKKIKIKIIL